MIPQLPKLSRTVDWVLRAGKPKAARKSLPVPVDASKSAYIRMMQEEKPMYHTRDEPGRGSCAGGICAWWPRGTRAGTENASESSTLEEKKGS